MLGWGVGAHTTKTVEPVHLGDLDYRSDDCAVTRAQKLGLSGPRSTSRSPRQTCKQRRKTCKYAFDTWTGSGTGTWYR